MGAEPAPAPEAHISTLNLNRSPGWSNGFFVHWGSYCLDRLITDFVFVQYGLDGVHFVSGDANTYATVRTQVTRYWNEFTVDMAIYQQLLDAQGMAGRIDQDYGILHDYLTSLVNVETARMA